MSELYFRTDVTPEDLFIAIGKLRREARREIEKLIAFLDKTDDYVSRELEDDDDREPDEGDEPSLGSSDRVIDQTKSWQFNRWDVDAEHDTADAEPSLGSLDHNHSQEAWAAGDRRDIEQDHAESGIADLDGLLEQIGSPDCMGAGGGSV